MDLSEIQPDYVARSSVAASGAVRRAVVSLFLHGKLITARQSLRLPFSVAGGYTHSPLKGWQVASSDVVSLGVGRSWLREVAAVSNSVTKIF